jgi:hypothetical protein
MKSLMIFTSHPIFLGGPVDKNEMVGACSTYGGE